MNRKFPFLFSTYILSIISGDTGGIVSTTLSIFGFIVLFLRLQYNMIGREQVGNIQKYTVDNAPVLLGYAWR